MGKKLGTVIASLVLFTLLLTGCKLPASTAPVTPTDVERTTPIVIGGIEPGEMTQTASANLALTATQEAEVDYFATPTFTPEPTIVVPTVTRPSTYALQEGEFPFCIARRFDLNIEALLSLNNIGTNQIISPGTILQIPQSGSWEGTGRVRNPHPTTHTVASGESIYSIACYYGDVSPEAIIAFNQLQEPYTLTVGQTLEIP